MNKITADMYYANPGRYTLVKGTTQGAPSCPYGNAYAWVGYDRETDAFVRFTKSVYNQLLDKIKNNQLI